MASSGWGVLVDITGLESVGGSDSVDVGVWMGVGEGVGGDCVSSTLEGRQPPIMSEAIKTARLPT